MVLQEIEATKFPQRIKKPKLRNQKNAKSKSIASNPQVLRKIASSKQARPGFLGKP